MVDELLGDCLGSSFHFCETLVVSIAILDETRFQQVGKQSSHS
jgi:hypothetical protein